MSAREDALAAYRRMKTGAEPIRRSEDHGCLDLPSLREVEWRRAVCDACEHIIRASAGLGCRKCPTCPSGREKRILFTLPKTASGRALFTCPEGRWDTYEGAAVRRPPRVFVIISSFNEGPRVRATVDAFRAVTALPVETVVVDDQSTDGSCIELPGHVIRRERATGIGPNFNDGAALALSLGADVLIFADAHVRVSSELVEAVAGKCCAGPGIASSASRAYGGLPVAGFGGRLARKDIISVQWALIQPTHEWTQIQAPIGGLYSMSAETARLLASPTGMIFDTTAGLYGYVEEMLAIKAHFLHVPVFVYIADPHQHLFKTTSERPGMMLERRRNLVYCLALYFSAEFFEERFLATAETLLPPEEVARLRREAEGKCKRSWTVDAEHAFYDALPEA